MMTDLPLLANNPYAINFFALDESIGILCSSLASPQLIATLLQLSKCTRRKLWKFLTDPKRSNFAWREEFYKRLYKYHKKRPSMELRYWSGHPCFIESVYKDFSTDAYHLCNILLFANTNGYNGGLVDVAISCYQTCFDGGKYAFPSWKCIRNVSTTDNIFQWYFVAQALTLCMNKEIVVNAQTRYDSEEPIVSNDIELFIK